ncbi:exodeoxyribonuclease III [Elioraea tepidiphila]|uniref:exodeoxyribonuclease III n=1 Tax=Elioraea tepidiphila TaxID=457934 RepID=UPI0003614E2D|nr:exodeoxyribonuclease III [Elioraea tepidiphila]
MKVATWNVNSVRARKAHLIEYLRADGAPDVVLLQELKVEEAGFPRAEVEEAGYHALVSGQKTYNGVAILSRLPAAERMRGLPDGDGDSQARYLEAEIGGLVVASVYAPNGNPVGTEKFAYKLAWMERMAARAAALFEEERAVVIGGDWNVCPTARDVWDERAMASDALLQPESRAAWRRLIWQGWTDAFRALHADEAGYTYWDYQAGAWPRDHGMRIDHLLLSPHAAQRLSASSVDRGPRGKDSPSDHTPVWCALTD